MEEKNMRVEEKRKALIALIDQTHDDDLIELLWDNAFEPEMHLTNAQTIWLGHKLEQSEKSFAEGRFVEEEKVVAMIEGLEDEDRLVG
jgi:hypothetical protein